MKTKYLILLWASSIAISSCRTSRFIYSPAPPNNPYFREKGESKLAAYYSTGGDNNQLTDEYNDGLDVQAAYAISNHWALAADYYKRNDKDVRQITSQTYFDSSIIRYDRHLTNFGVGYFIPIPDKKTVVFNFFAGVGLGKLSFADNGVDNNNSYSRYYNNDLTKWYLQSAINLYGGKYFRTAFVGKVSWVHYGEPTTSYTSDESEFLDLHLLRGKTLCFLEPSWNVQVTTKKMQWLYFDAGFTFCTDPFDNSTNLEARNFNASIGLSVDFSKMKKK